MRAYERLLRYVTYDTQSAEDSGTSPSTERQLVLARQLAEELSTLGCEQVRCDGHCYVYAVLPATPGCEGAPRIGFIAHMDTSPDAPGAGVRPQLLPDYDGGEVALGQSGRVLSPAMFPHLPTLRGRTLITTDGTTLLGADDKAGIAEIMTLVERLQQGGVPHGRIGIAFTPDEEIGAGADHFDVAGFGCQYAYTVDGGQENVLEYENFNASAAHLEIRGVSVHPGGAKGIMVNAALVACELNAMLPAADIPARTQDYEGFFHLTDMQGDVEHATMDYIIRDHNAESFACREATLRHAVAVLNEKYGEGTVSLTLREQYRNMREQLADCMHLIHTAEQAVRAVGLTPVTEAIRGGTDGARLSYMGLPCPNLGTGGYAYHGPYEHITVEGMDAATDILLEIVRLYAGMTEGV